MREAAIFYKCVSPRISGVTTANFKERIKGVNYGTAVRDLLVTTDISVFLARDNECAFNLDNLLVASRLRVNRKFRRDALTIRRKSRNNLMEGGRGSTNCASFAIKRRTCISPEYNRGPRVFREKKATSTSAGCTRVFSCQLVAVEWKKPISPVANGWSEAQKLNKAKRREGEKGRKKKLTCDFLGLSLTERAGKGSKPASI